MTAEQLRADVMRRRTAQGLQIRLLTPEGEETTLYPKDQATKQQWLAAAQRKGYTVVQEGR